MNILLGEVNTEFASHPESRLILPKSSVQIGGPLWKRYTPSYYLAELVAALRGAGRLKGKLGVGPAPDWFPTDKWSWRHFNNQHYHREVTPLEMYRTYVRTGFGLENFGSGYVGIGLGSTGGSGAAHLARSC